MNVISTLSHQLTSMTTQFIRLLPQLAIALVVLIITWAAAKFANRIAAKLLDRTSVRPSLVNLVETVVAVLIWVIGILITLAIVFPGVTPGNLLAVLGLGTVAIGFAFKDVFENFLAGLLIMLRKKMDIGDIIECEGVEGRVEHITLRDTHLRHLSNELVVVPNSYLFKNPVKILTDGQLRRHEITVGVAYDVDVDAAHELILSTVKACESVSDEREAQVFAAAFGASSIDFTVRWWAGSKPADMHKSRDEVVRKIKRALDDAGMEIPFPYTTLTFKEPLPIRRAPADPSR